MVRVVRLRVAVTARGERSLTLAALADLACRTEAVRVVRLGVTVTALGQTPTLDTLRPGGAGGGRGVCRGVTVAAGGEGRLAGAVLAHVARRTEAVGVLGVGVAVAALGQTDALDALSPRGAGGVLGRGERVAVTAGREHRGAACRGQSRGRICNTDLSMSKNIFQLRLLTFHTFI